jgi:hypothetical protein
LDNQIIVFNGFVVFIQCGSAKSCVGLLINHKAFQYFIFDVSNLKTMKRMNNFIVTICFSVMAVFSSANNKHQQNSTVKSETSQIQAYLDKLDYGKLIPASTDLQVNFIVSDAKEIMVVSTNNLELDAFIKTNLNYKPIETNKLERNTTYTVFVHIVIPN